MRMEYRTLVTGRVSCIRRVHCTGPVQCASNEIYLCVLFFPEYSRPFAADDDDRWIMAKMKRFAVN